MSDTIDYRAKFSKLQSIAGLPLIISIGQDIFSQQITEKLHSVKAGVTCLTP